MCSAHLAQAVALPGAWSGRGCVEQQAPPQAFLAFNLPVIAKVKVFLVFWRPLGPSPRPLSGGPAGCEDHRPRPRHLLGLGAALWGSFLGVLLGKRGVHEQGSGERLLTTPSGNEP